MEEVEEYKDTSAGAAAEETQHLTDGQPAPDGHGVHSYEMDPLNTAHGVNTMSGALPSSNNLSVEEEEVILPSVDEISTSSDSQQPERLSSKVSKDTHHGRTW
jgi:hypothetical protein